MYCQYLQKRQTTLSTLFRTAVPFPAAYLAMEKETREPLKIQTKNVSTECEKTSANEKAGKIYDIL
jgi:hypothetical protein